MKNLKLKIWNKYAEEVYGLVLMQIQNSFEIIFLIISVALSFTLNQIYNHISHFDPLINLRTNISSIYNLAVRYTLIPLHTKNTIQIVQANPYKVLLYLY